MEYFYISENPDVILSSKSSDIWVSLFGLPFIVGGVFFLLFTVTNSLMPLPIKILTALFFFFFIYIGIVIVALKREYEIDRTLKVFIERYSIVGIVYREKRYDFSDKSRVLVTRPPIEERVQRRRRSTKRKLWIESLNKILVDEIATKDDALFHAKILGDFLSCEVLEVD